MKQGGVADWWRAVLASVCREAPAQAPTVDSFVVNGKATPLSDWLPLNAPSNLGTVRRIAHVTGEGQADGILANRYIGGVHTKANFSTCWYQCLQAEQFEAVLIFDWSGAVGMGAAAAPSGSELYHHVNADGCYIESWIAHGQARGLELVALGRCGGKTYADCEVVSVEPVIPTAVKKLP